MAKLSRTSNRVVCAILAMVLVAIVGCGRSGPGMVKVTGVVLYKGRPLSGARVTFQAPSSPRPAVGTTNEAGEFTLGTMSTSDGAVIGEHRVAITTFTPEAIAKMSTAEQEALGRGEKVRGSILPSKYASLEKSHLTAVVEARGKNHFRFELMD